MGGHRQEEYAALRATIRERGTVRVVLFCGAIAVWAILVVTVAAAVPIPAAALVPLLVLVAAFEAIHSLHVGVERVGRYLQVFHEDGWEDTAMAYGQRFPGGGTDALFAAVFWVAAVTNLFPLLLTTPTTAELVPIGLAHLLFMARVLQARRRSAGQRARDLDRFQTLAANQPPRPPSPPAAPDRTRP
jgi:hypothetical protein